MQLADRFDPEMEDERGSPVATSAPATWRQWLADLFPTYVSAGFAPRHERLWEWADSIEPGKAPRPFVAVWPRGGAKSTSAELIATRLGAEGVRRYIVYLRATQDDADDSVSNIAAMLESTAFAERYPEHSARQLSKFGHAKGWRRNRVRTAGGLTIDALGMDVAMRGTKIDDQRPDMIIIDDVDQEEDGHPKTEKKIRALTKKILPAGSSDCAILVAQNLIIPDGVVARIVNGKADFLVRAVIDGPHPAVEGLEIKREWDERYQRNRAVIVAGVATWEGQSLEHCQEFVDRFGLAAFMAECQQDVKVREGALWTPELIEDMRYLGQVPPLKEIAVANDPSGGAAEVGIIGGGLGYDGKVYLLVDASQPYRHQTRQWAESTADTAEEIGTDTVVAEWNFGGELVRDTLKVANPSLRVHKVVASRGKRIRAAPTVELCEEGRVKLCGHFPELEAELTGWEEGQDSPNRLDAFVILLFWLVIRKMKRRSGRSGFRVPKEAMARPSKWGGLRLK